MQLAFYAREYSFFKLPHLETPRSSLRTSCDLMMATYLAKVRDKLHKLKSHNAGCGPNPALWNLTGQLWAYWKYFFGRMLQFISLPLKIEFIRDTNAQLIQNLITSYHKNQERTREKKRERKNGENRSHDWKKKAPKPCCNVSLQRWMDQWNCSEVNIRE